MYGIVSLLACLRCQVLTVSTYLTASLWPNANVLDDSVEFYFSPPSPPLPPATRFSVTPTARARSLASFDSIEYFCKTAT